MDCVFCRIVNEDETAFVIGEDDQTLWFLNKTQKAKGHTLVVPKAHHTDLLSAPVEVAASVMAGAHRASSILMERLAPEGMSLFQFNREAGWQDVFHLHLHVIPRTRGDALTPAWTSQPLTLEELATVAADLGATRRG